MRAHFQKLQSRLQAYLKGNVKFALLFGSVLTDYFRSNSDVDLVTCLIRFRQFSIVETLARTASLSVIHRAFAEIDPEALSDYDVQDIFVLNLQRAIQAAIDIANLIISAQGYRLPNSYKLAFDVLKESAWLDADTSDKMQRMVGFRNIAINDYQEIEPEILKSILTKHLSDFETFYKQVLKRLHAKN